MWQMAFATKNKAHTAPGTTQHMKHNLDIRIKCTKQQSARAAKATFSQQHDIFH